MDVYALVLGLLALIAAAVGLAWLARASTEAGRERLRAEAEDARRRAEAAEAARDYEALKAALTKEGEDRAHEVDRRGPDALRAERLLRGGAPPQEA